MVAVVLTLVGMPIQMTISRGIGGTGQWPALLVMAIATGLLGFLFVRREHPSVRAGNAVFLVNAALIISTLWLTNIAYAHSGRIWVPFEANKLGMITVAMIAPELWVGLVGIAAYAGAVYVQMATIDAASRTHFALAEPWATTVIALFSTVFLFHHLRRTALERELARVKAEAAAMQRAARFVVAVRDLSNTPLQTIALATALAKDRHPDLEPILARVERSLTRLSELDQLLREEERRAHWTRDQESFDAADTLRTAAVVQ